MGKPSDQIDNNNVVDLQSPDRKTPRRRFVQRTLFPLKPHQDSKLQDSDSKKEAAKKVVDDDERHEDDVVVDVECCGSQEGKRKRGRKPKQNSTPQKRGRKKGAANGKDASMIDVVDIESPDDGSPQKLKEKQRFSKKNGRTNSNKWQTNPVATQRASPPVPDLRLEAKWTAEENSRLFAGKQMHPFFSSQKVGKKDQETTEVDSNGCIDKRKERNPMLGPIHVFENIKDDVESIDWSHWPLSEGTFSNSTCDQESTLNSLGTSAGSLSFDTINILNSLGTSPLTKGVSSAQHAGAYEDTFVIPMSISPIVVDDEKTPVTANDLLKNIEKDFAVNGVGFAAGNFGHLCSEFEQQNAVMRERIMSYHLNRGSHPENSFWTSKYQPEKALEVCGNSESVKFINEWLRLWHANDFHVSKRSSGLGKGLMRGDDYDSYDSDSYDSYTDMDNVAKESGLKNVLLVTGPVGSGKTAAIYACAKEQGFQVIEVNASDWRSGALLKQKFGEAVGLHWLKRSQENPVGSQSKLNFKSSSAVSANASAATLDLNHDAAEVIFLAEEEDAFGGDGNQCPGKGKLRFDQGEIKTLILFEDVDATLCEDRGFISTIQQLADTGKRPMILTSNSANPVLPDNLDREEVSFTLPSLTELIHHIYLVCAAERAYVQPHLIERCIQFYRGDIRRTLMHLQFWCQRERCMEDGKLQSMYTPLIFDLDAGHSTLPILISWELPSSLSEFIEEEIDKSLCRMRMEEDHSLLEVIEEEVGNASVQNYLDFNEGETTSIEAKKEAILKENCFHHVDSDIIPISNACEFSNSSGSPVAFTRRNFRKNVDAVLSDSEDEISNHAKPVAADGFCIDDDNNNISLIPAVDDTLNAPGDSKFCSGAVNAELFKPSSETAHLNHINLSAVSKTCKPSNDHPIYHTEESPVEIQHQHQELLDLNHRSQETAIDINPTADQLLLSRERNTEANRNQYTVIGRVNHNFTTVGNPGTLSTDQEIHFREVNGEETVVANVNCIQEAENHSLIPLSYQVQQYSKIEMAVTRCLFPQTPHNDPIPSIEGSTWNQSTDQLIPCGESGITELRLEMGIVNPSQDAADDTMNLLLDQSQCHGTATMEHIEQNVYPSSHTAVDDSFKPSSDKLFYSEAKGEEMQHPKSADVCQTSCTPVDDSLKQMSDLLPFEEAKLGSVHQFPETADFGIGYRPVQSNPFKPSRGQILQLSEANTEDQQLGFSEATNGDQNIYRCQSADISCVPESTFVPETEVNDGRELPGVADMMEIVSPVAVGNFNSSVTSHKTADHIRHDIDINVTLTDEEMGDSQSENEYLEASTSGCQVMDECSRMDFYKRSKSFRRSRSVAQNVVQERWNDLRKTDLRQHFILEHKNALEVLDLAYEMSNLISEADLLLRDCQFLTSDYADQELGQGDEFFTFDWHNQQVQMASTIAEHGYCFYANSIDVLQSKNGIDKRVHLAREMLASTNNSMALGKLLRLGRSRTESSLSGRSSKWATPSLGISLTSEREVIFQNIALSTVPLRSYLTLRGNALHEYLSTLGHISQSEASRLAEAAEKTKRRRVRVAKNYLSSGGLDLSPDDISVLLEYNHYGKVSSE